MKSIIRSEDLDPITLFLATQSVRIALTRSREKISVQFIPSTEVTRKQHK